MQGRDPLTPCAVRVGWQVHAVLLELAKQGKLAGQVGEAKETMKRKLAERQAKGQPLDVDDEM